MKSRSTELGLCMKATGAGLRACRIRDLERFSTLQLFEVQQLDGATLAGGTDDLFDHDRRLF
jgi:hypothetical protein